MSAETEIVFDSARRSVNAPSGLQEFPGRNDSRYGAWMLSTLIPGTSSPVVADPMCGGGQLWLLRGKDVSVVGCELKAERVAVARAGGIQAECGEAESWTPPCVPDLVGFSPPYPNCDHSSGSTDHQKDLVASKGLQSMQAIEQVPCMWRVFAQIATYADKAPVAVICKNYVQGTKGLGKKGQAEVDWVSELAASMAMAGLGEVTRYWRKVPPGPTEQWKLARDPSHRVVTREYVLVARR